MSNEKWIPTEPYVDETGIYLPVHPFREKGYSAEYKLVMTADMFREAYIKYILKDSMAQESKR